MLNLRMNVVAEVIQEVAEEAILPYFRKLEHGQIRFKSENNPVTIADIEAESALSKRLLDLMPGSFVLGEESYAENPALLELFEEDSPVWVIDPVDGTKAFIAGEPVYGVIVALTKRNQTLAGWLYDPTSKEFVMAERGGGAWHKGLRLSVLPPAPLPEMAGVLNAAYRENLKEQIPASAPHPFLCRALSSCHDYARLVVQAPHFSRPERPIHFLANFGSCTPWDVAAGALIHHEAGGFTAHWEQDGFSPCHMGRGFLSAPDEESWMQMRDWLRRYASLPPVTR